LKCDSLGVQLEIGKVYLRNADAVGAKRMWKDAMTGFQQAAAESSGDR